MARVPGSIEYGSQPNIEGESLSAICDMKRDNHCFVGLGRFSGGDVNKENGSLFQMEIIDGGI
jgi:hypothetical protein